jgi:putative spermidine/putrescine transport system substrate-binding protein
MTMRKQRLGTAPAAALAAFALALAFAAPAAFGAGKRFDGVTIRIGTWGGIWRDFQAKIIAPKMLEMGATVDYVTGSPQDNLAKLVAARGREPPFDVLDTFDASLPSVMQGKMFQRIDVKAIPNFEFLESWQHDEFKVASWITEEAICYNRQKFDELGIPSPTTYRDLANPKLAGRVLIPDIASGGGLANFAAISYAQGGDLVNVKPALDLITSIKGVKFWRQAEQAVTQFQTGDIYAAVIHAGWCAFMKKGGQPVAVVHPIINATTKGVLKQGWIGIVSGTKNPAAAAAYINQFLAEDFQFEFAKVNGLVAVNRLAQAKMAQDPVLKEMLILDPGQMNSMLKIDYSKANISDWIDQWHRTVAR